MALDSIVLRAPKDTLTYEEYLAQHEALGHKDENLDGVCDVCGNKLDSPVPPTGDHSYVMIIVLLVSVTAAGIILIALPRRRRNSAR